MSKKTFWRCDNPNCSRELPSWDLPPGWLSIVFTNNGREYRYSLCSYACLAAWASDRAEHYGSKSEPVNDKNGYIKEVNHAEKETHAGRF